MVKEKAVNQRLYDVDGYRKRAACVCVKNENENEVLSKILYQKAYYFNSKI
jgi:diphosphoinositol-polyphosphate diphosphatase